MILYDNIGQVLLNVKVDDNSYRNRVIRGDNNLTLYYSLPEHIDIPVGTWCEFEGQRYELLQPENFKKHGTRNFEYTLIMEAEQAKLKKYKFREIVYAASTQQFGGTRRLKFLYTAKPQEHIKMLVDNLNSREPGWSIGDCIESAERVLSYNHTNCWDALNQIADTFNTEWEIVNKTIHLRKVEYNKNNPLSLSYGRGNGFRPGLGRANYDESNPVEILFVQGGSRNINASLYGATELLLPKNQQLTYEGRVYKTDADGFSIQRADKALKTMAEDSLDCSNIYPSRVGTVSSVVVVDANNNLYDFIDDSIPQSLDFSQLQIDGEKLTVIFQSGMLSGREFDVIYTHSNRRFEIVSQQLDGRTMPDNIFKPTIGDKYAVFGMMLPNAYISDNNTQTGASWDMFREAVKYFYENEEPRFSFTGELDGIWAKEDWLNIGGKIKLGGYILFTDNQFQTEGVLIRIINIKDYINNPHSPVVELSNITVGGTVVGQLNKIEENEVVTEDLYRDALQFTRRRYRDSIETIGMLENALLDKFTNSISPITIQTMAMLVGDESLQFRFVNNKTNPVEIPHNVTYNTTTKILTSPAGIIQHMTLGITSISSSHKAGEYKFWDVPLFNSPPLTDDSKKYYLYARVSTAGTTGVFYLSETAIGMTSVAGYYYLLVGILNSAFEDTRSYVDLYGFTEVLPGQILTNRVVSADGQNFIDFLNNAFRVGSANNSIDWNVSVSNQLSIINAAIKLGTSSAYSTILNPDGSGILGNGNIEWDSVKTRIADWIIKSGKITSQNNTNYGTPRAQLDGQNGGVNLASDVAAWTENGGAQTAKQTIKLDSQSGQIGSNFNNYEDVSYVSSQGIFARTRGSNPFSATTGMDIKAAVAGVAYGAMNQAYWAGNFMTGVLGYAQNISSNPAPAYGGYFYNLMAVGLYVSCRTTTSTITLGRTDVLVSCYNTSAITVYLPSSPYIGQLIIIRRNNSADVTVNGNGNSILRNTASTSFVLGSAAGTGGMFIYDGGYWLYYHIPYQ